MPATYSINVGTQLEAYRKPDIISVLKDIPDNTHKLISPKDIRDAFLSTWANSPFKQTKNKSGIEYIGIDSGNPSNRDIKQKIFLGKRSYANLDIMTDSLLNNSADIYIYNTKPDSYLTQSSTKVAILAGTDSSLHEYAPYIESKVENGMNHLEFKNPSPTGGPINIYSSNGRVAINGILFPTVTETNAGASNGNVLKYSGSYPNGYLKWGPITFDETNVGATGVATNIYGSPIKVNGHSLEFIDSSIVPVAVGGIPVGFSFSTNSYNSPITGIQQNWPLSEVIRKILYPYLEPTLSLSVVDKYTGSTYGIAGKSMTASLTYLLTIYPRIPEEYVSNYYIVTQQKHGNVIGATQGTSYYGTSFEGLPGKTFSTTIDFVISDPGNSSGGFYNFTMAYSNVPGTDIAGYPLTTTYNSGWSYSTSAEIQFIKPIYHGFTGTSSAVSFRPNIAYSTSPGNLNSYVTNNLIPLYSNLDMFLNPCQIDSTLKFNITGTGHICFLYPRANGIGTNMNESNLLSIKDPNGFVLYQKGSPTASVFYPGTFDMVSQTGATEYVLWESKYPCGYTGEGYFELAFGTSSTFSWPVPTNIPSGTITNLG
jgi:hypothetical protein